VGFETREAENGQEALRVFDEWQPHVIAMDERMPVMSGYEAIGRLRESERGREVRVIVVTASALDDSYDKALGLGADDYLGKPYRENSLFEKIQNLIGVEYVYAEQDAGSLEVEVIDEDEVPFASSDLPAGDVIRDIREAVLAAESDRALELIGTLQASNPLAAGRLRRLVEHYEYQKLLDLLPEPEGVL
jgi:CheY-like chemotaxis protein